MSEEFVSIMEAARRCGISDKTIRRAVHAGKLPANRRKSNYVEIAVSDLAAWRELSADVQEQRLATMEAQIEDLQRQVEHLSVQVEEQARVIAQLSAPSPVVASKAPAQKAVELAPSTPPEGLILLREMADVHGVSRNEAERRYKTGMIAGVKRPWPGYKREVIALGPKGRRDFWAQFHQIQGFQACDDCPHITEEK